MIKQKKIIVVLIFVFLIPLFSACSIDDKAGTTSSDPQIPDFTTETGRVIDMTGQLSPEWEQQWEQMLSELDSRGWQTVIAVFNNLESDPVLFGTEVMNKNGIGNADRNDGLVIVIFLEKEGSDKKKPSIGVAVGAGLEGDFNDAKVGRLLDNTFVPQRADGHWEQGVTAFLTEYANLRSGVTTWDQYPEKKDEINWVLIMAIIVLIVIFLTLDGKTTGFAMTRSIGSSAAKSIGSGGFGRGGGASR